MHPNIICKLDLQGRTPSTTYNKVVWHFREQGYKDLAGMSATRPAGRPLGADKQGGSADYQGIRPKYMSGGAENMGTKF